MNDLHSKLIAERLNIPSRKVNNTLSLFSEGATIPFIARYRKEATGSLDEVQVADIQREAKKLEELDKRRASILGSIEEQGKLTDDLRRRIEGTYDGTVLEDLYLPYKRKRKTRASVAREKGLEPLAEVLFQTGRTQEAIAEIKRCVQEDGERPYYQKQLERFLAGDPAVPPPDEE